MRKLLIVQLAAVCSGCLTVGLDNEFVETVETYHEDGTVASAAETRWTQNARGGPFTDVEQLKQDTAYSYRSETGEAYEIGQGSGATGVIGSGQVDALTEALRALSGVVATLTPGAAAVRQEE